MRKNKIIAAILAVALLLCCMFTVVGCDLLEEENTHACTHVCKICSKCLSECENENCKEKCLGHIPTADDILAEQLKSSLKNYLQTEKFKNSVANARTAAAWLPLSYLRYVKGEFFTFDNARVFLNYMNMIEDLLIKTESGEYVLSDSKWSGSAACAQGWYGLTDYLNTWSICYNLYAQYCESKGILDNHFDMYLAPIASYLGYIDNWLAGSNKTYEIRWVSGETITQSNLYYQGYNCFNRVSYSEIKEYDYEYWVKFMGILATATGNIYGHEKFLNEYKTFWDKVDTMSSQELTDTGKVLLKYFKDCLPVTQVAFGYSAYSYLAIIKANLGLNVQLNRTDEFFLSYYEKGEDGKWLKSGGTPNWVGPSGRPIGASLYRDNEKYSVDYEKCMQGYFPFTDGWNQPLEEMINLDRLCNFYNHQLGTGANVTPQWALLTAMMHGIDMEHYTKVEPLVDEEKGIFEDGTEQFNVITFWQNNLEKSETGEYIISNNLDAAVAIAYIAKYSGVEAPSPIGKYSKDNAVITL